MLWKKNDIEMLRLERELREGAVLGLDESDDEDYYDRVDRYYYLECEGEEGPHYKKPGDFYWKIHRAVPGFYMAMDVGEEPGDDFWRKPDRPFESLYL